MNNRRKAYKRLYSAYRALFREQHVIGHNGQNTLTAAERALDYALRYLPVNQVMDIRDLTFSNINHPAGDSIEWQHYIRVSNMRVPF
jgi:hypothetical protein